MASKFCDKVTDICQRDRRYKPDAYEFVMQALWFTQKKLKRKDHISGQELLEGIKEFGLDQFGPMAKTVFHHWGIKVTEDFGEIVFNMVENGIMSKAEKDSREDFKNAYAFDDVFDVFRAK